MIIGTLPLLAIVARFFPTSTRMMRLHVRAPTDAISVLNKSYRA